MAVLITGGTGLIGQALLRQLDGAVVLTRDPIRARQTLPDARLIRWHPGEDSIPPEAFEGVQVVYHLAGEPIANQRWTPAIKDQIRESRLLGTRQLVAGLAALPRPPAVLISASAVGYYGNRADELLDETTPPGEGFLAEVCASWEAEALKASRLGIRVVCLRLGLVLSTNGGVLARMLAAFRLGLGGRLGSGMQWVPWIHVADVVGLLLHASRVDTILGPLNAVSPHPVRNSDFTQELAQALRRPAIIPVPQLALKLAFGEMGQLLTASQRAIPGVAASTGYAFRHAILAEALRDLLIPPASPKG